MIYDRPSDAMMAKAREWLGFVMLGPSHEQEFQRQLAEIGGAETISLDDAMTLGHAALMIADVPEFQTFAALYRERAVMLFCRAFDAAALEREARAATEAGMVQ